MLHNGIGEFNPRSTPEGEEDTRRLISTEHAHLSILCEIRALLYHQLGMSNDDIADLFDKWYNDKVNPPTVIQSASERFRANVSSPICYEGTF